MCSLATQYLDEDEDDFMDVKDKRTMEAFQRLALVECDPRHTHATRSCVA